MLVRRVARNVAGRIARGITAFPLGSLEAAVRALFSSGQQGAWYDPSDITTLYQDSAGTTPCTMPGQGSAIPVGLMLDKRLQRQELAVTGWAKTSGDGTVTVNGNVVTISGATTTTRVDIASPGWVIGDYADISLTGDISGATSPALYVGGGDVYSALSGAKSLKNMIRSTTLLRVQIDSGSATFTLSSRGRVPGNHAYQTTPTSRPILSARVNILLATATLSTQSVTTAATNYRLYFTGTGSVALSGTATGTYSAGTHTITCTAGTLTLTVTGSVLTADLRAANESASLPVYQRVADANTYDTTGFGLYLAVDGSDDFMVTNSIDFSASDKVFVAAGVRKLSNTGEQCLAELSATDSGNNGMFYLSGNFFGSDIGWRSKGTTARSVSGAAAAPISVVALGTGDISGDSAILRVNGVQATPNTSDQGTGNYGSYPLYLFRRGGSSLPFNGRFYGAVIRGGTLPSDAQIVQTERYLAGKTGVVLA